MSKQASDSFLEECYAVLSRTPATLDALLRDMPPAWIQATEGGNTWSPYAVLGHLVHCEITDWLPRLKIILEHGPARPFDPFDREAQFKEGLDRTMEILLDQFRERRAANLEELKAMRLGPEQLALVGTHPVLGTVTARQLVATWTTHDLAHLLQVNRIMAKRMREEVGPWAEFLSVMQPAAG